MPVPGGYVDESFGFEEADGCADGRRTHAALLRDLGDGR